MPNTQSFALALPFSFRILTLCLPLLLLFYLYLLLQRPDLNSQLLTLLLRLLNPFLDTLDFFLDVFQPRLDSPLGLVAVLFQ